MPGTRSKVAKTKKLTEKKRLVKATINNSNGKKGTVEEKQTKDSGTEMAYKRVYNKMQERRKNKVSMGQENGKGKKRKNDNVAMEGEESMDEGPQIIAQFIEEDNIMDIRVTEDQSKEFPSEGEITDSDEEPEENDNSNAVRTAIQSSRSSSSPTALPRTLPEQHENGPSNSGKSGNDFNAKDATNLQQTFALMQNFMLKKGLINATVDATEFTDFLNMDSVEDHRNNSVNKSMNQTKKTITGQKSRAQEKGMASVNKQVPCKNAESELTVYT